MELEKTAEPDSEPLSTEAVEEAIGPSERPFEFEVEFDFDMKPFDMEAVQARPEEAMLEETAEPDVEPFDMAVFDMEAAQARLAKVSSCQSEQATPTQSTGTTQSLPFRPRPANGLGGVGSIKRGHTEFLENEEDISEKERRPERLDAGDESIWAPTTTTSSSMGYNEVKCEDVGHVSTKQTDPETGGNNLVKRIKRGILGLCTTMSRRT